jgi:hypothetical protein
MLGTKHVCKHYLYSRDTSEKGTPVTYPKEVQVSLCIHTHTSYMQVHTHTHTHTHTTYMQVHAHKHTHTNESSICAMSYNTGDCTAWCSRLRIDKSFALDHTLHGHPCYICTTVITQTRKHSLDCTQTPTEFPTL